MRTFEKVLLSLGVLLMLAGMIMGGISVARADDTSIRVYGGVNSAQYGKNGWWRQSPLPWSFDGDSGVTALEVTQSTNWHLLSDSITWNWSLGYYDLGTYDGNGFFVGEEIGEYAGEYQEINKIERHFGQLILLVLALHISPKALVLLGPAGGRDSGSGSDGGGGLRHSSVICFGWRMKYEGPRGHTAGRLRGSPPSSEWR